MAKKTGASLLPLVAVVLMAVTAVTWLGSVAMTTPATAASEPTFGITTGDIARLNMTVEQTTQVVGDDPTDSRYYIDAPVNITVRNQDGTLLENVTVMITGPHTNYANFTDANGTMAYMFNQTEITQGDDKIAVRASKLPQYPYAEKVIRVGYAGILNMGQGNTLVDVQDVPGLFGGTVEANIYFTSVVVDAANGSQPEAGVNVTAVVTDTANVDTNTLNWLTDGEPGTAQSGDSAFSSQSQITDANGEVTFGVFVKQEQTKQVVEVALGMTSTKASFMTTTSSSSITVDGQGNCFIATAAYGSPLNENLDILRAFRDRILLTNPPGQFLVETYYLTSPPVADALSKSARLRAATRVFLLTPLVYFSALCMNLGALVAAIVLLLLVLIVLKRHAAVLLSGIGYGALVIAAFTTTVFTLGALGYELPICAAVAADLLPLIIPVAVAACVLRWLLVARKRHKRGQNFYSMFAS